ncbi:Similar to lola: Longitudinals lacking protein [Cotesia congregata]|uniref:Isoforms J/P/Q/S/Z (Drosophila melanogaster) n=1 Tax=Cotesia congregata TaxID=51543 RepID=A0A8J2HHE7_COTCN|nr:Similar to lola: Longitudinals lacking protein [Cotesia congregata]
MFYYYTQAFIYNPQFQSSNVFRCHFCGRSFTWIASLRLHQKMACGKPPNFYCSLCTYKSNFKGNLKRHMFNVHKIVLPPAISYRQAPAPRVSSLRADVLLGIEPQEAPQNGLWQAQQHSLFLPLLPLQIQSTRQFLQASPLCAQHQKSILCPAPVQGLTLPVIRARYATDSIVSEAI